MILAWASPFKPLSPTAIVFIPFYKPIKSLLLGMKLVFKHQDLEMFSLKLNKII